MTNNTCYLSNNKIESEVIPCDPTGNITNACCAVGSVCLSNGLCYGSNVPTNYFPYERTACTDITGNGCLLHCEQYNNGYVSLCGNQFTGYCCFDDHAKGACNCDTGENAFTLPYGTPISTIGTLDPSDATQLAASMTTIKSLLNRGITEGTIPPTTSTTTPTETSSPSTSSQNSPHQASAFHSSSTSSPLNSNSSAIQDSHHLSTGAEVGIVVGVVLLVLIACVIGWVIIVRRRRSVAAVIMHRDGYLGSEMPVGGDKLGKGEWVPELSSKGCVVELPSNKGHVAELSI